MKKTLITMVFVIVFALSAYTQRFIPIDSIRINSIGQSNGQIVDLDSDRYLNYLVVYQDSSQLYTGLMINFDSASIDTVNLPLLNQTGFHLTDINNNSRPDLTFSTGNEMDSLFIYLQSDSLSFSRVPYDTLPVSHLAFVDLDQNGKKDLIYQQGENLLIKRFTGSGFVPFDDSIKIDSVKSWIAIADSLSRSSLMVIGTDSTDWLIRAVNQKLSLKDTLFQFRQFDEVKQFDYNNDGILDFLAAGNTANGFEIKIFDRDTIIQIAQMDSLDYYELFAADLNSDGLEDINLSGGNRDTVGLIRKFYNLGNQQFSMDSLYAFANKVSISFGDPDFDGDLDQIVHLVSDSSTVIIRYINTTEETNLPPEIVEKHYQFSMVKGLAIAWQDALDDLTPAEALTYGVFVGESEGTAEVLSPNFLPIDPNRFIPSKGNSGPNNSIKLSSIAPGVYAYGIQSIDNSLYYLSPDCEGFGSRFGLNGVIARGTVEVCDTVKLKEQYYCLGEEVNIEFSEPKPIYSVSKGFLGEITSYSTILIESDTLYVGNLTCNDTSAYALNVIKPSNLIQPTDTIVCKGSELALFIDGIDRIQWSSLSGDILSNEPLLAFEANQNGQIYVEAFRKKCAIRDTLYYSVSIPTNINLNSTLTITKGDLVNYTFPEIYTYSWSPETGVENPQSNQPTIASRSSRSYVMTTSDSLNCEINDTIQVTVVDQAWLPDLFTPNGDGNNDLLKVYGLSNVSDFHFSIFSREGVKVYETSNISEISNSGWDGKKGGKDLPVGVYTWQVTGVLDDNSQVKLNGQSKGVIYLMK
ncbi:MAG: gliding motility-associated C-terminal domain-containing protein [Marinoscillum sp.]